MLIRVFILIGFISFISCANPKPRKPISRTGSVDMSASIALNKKLLLHEENIFKAIIAKDTAHTYLDSHFGFWYTYDIKEEKNTPKPIKGNEVTFEYDVKNIEGKIIYSKEELGDKTYLVDQQDFMQGIQEGIKLMKVNEKVIFLLPSQKAYAYYGDEKKIGSNTPLIVTITLLEIKTN
ncbi:MAG TPA: gliding motility-associated peptidyl-prolyl isomerase GldI [Lutibacter sp.]|nr:gliding motility-associated peptidyl-prolyl isomerase GldI [Lutibacter sp.]